MSSPSNPFPIRVPASLVWRVVPALLVAVLLVIFGLLADEVVEGDTLSFDRSILLLFRVPGNPADPIGPAWVEEAVRDITALGSVAILTLVTTLVVVQLLLLRRRHTAVYMLVAVVGGSIISTVLKLLFDRPRPDLEGVARVFTASFPSGHATLSAVVYLTIGAILAGDRAAAGQRAFYLIAAASLTLIVGMSRLYLGVHYPTDVLAGWLLGSAWALLCWSAQQLFVLNDTQPSERPSQV